MRLQRLQPLLPLTAFSFLALGATPAQASPPSPFTDRDYWADLYESPDGKSFVKVNPQTCRVKQKRTYQWRSSPSQAWREFERVALFYTHQLAEPPFQTVTPSPHKFRYRKIFDAGRTRCASSFPGCIEFRQRIDGGSGSWSDQSSAVTFFEIEQMDQASRCTPFTLPGSDGFSWTFHDVTTGPRNPVPVGGSQNTKTFAADREREGGQSTVHERLAVCRVVEHGATLIGTVQSSPSGKSGYRLNPSTHQWELKTVTGTHQFCHVDRGETQYGVDRGTKRYLSFEVLSGSSLARWVERSGNYSTPNEVFNAGTLDRGIAHVCMTYVSETMADDGTPLTNAVTGVPIERTYRRFGWWMEGMDHCEAILPLSRTTSPAVLLNPQKFFVLTRK